MAIVFNLGSEVRYFCFCGGVDMRKGIRSLYGIIKSAEGCSSSALSGDAFVFIGTTRKSVKILRWQREGFILYHKRLEVGTFNLPRLSGDGSFIELQSAEFERLIGSVNHKSCGGELRRKAMLMI
ncbi:MAG: IS66 family insertion sequence element accessory protein TnpB [Rikenellaceae bacterium]